MNMGGPGRLTDLLHCVKHPFLADIEAMIIKIRDHIPRYLDRIDLWDLTIEADPSELVAGRTHLRALLDEYESDLTYPKTIVGRVVTATITALPLKSVVKSV
jgi:hypothetical protein